MKEWAEEEGEQDEAKNTGFKEQSRNREHTEEASIEDMEKKDSRREEP